VRLMRSTILRFAGEAGGGDDAQTLTRLTDILVDLGYLQPAVAQLAVENGIEAVEREVATLLFDPAAPNGLLGLLDNLQRTAGLVRQRLSSDSWRILYGLNRRASIYSASVGLDVDGALALLNEILESLAAFSGMQMENMTRSLGWRLLDIGRRVERISHMSRLIREMTTDGDPASDGRLELLLELGDSSMTYRTRYLSTVQLYAVIDLLLTDDSNPRSVAFQVKSLSDHLRTLPHEQENAVVSREQYLITAMDSQLRLADLAQLCAIPKKDRPRDHLIQFLFALERQNYELSDVLARKYFTHVVPTRSTTVRGLVP
jgi:uncharacterized alpha-E superfamily protein